MSRLFPPDSEFYKLPSPRFVIQEILATLGMETKFVCVIALNQSHQNVQTLSNFTYDMTLEMLTVENVCKFLILNAWSLIEKFIHYVSPQHGPNLLYDIFKSLDFQGCHFYIPVY